MKNNQHSFLPEPNTVKYSLPDLARRTVTLIEFLDERGVHAADEVLDGLRFLGYSPDAHVNVSEPLEAGSRERLEWYVGTLISALVNHRWSEINGIINQYISHCPIY